ncbi:MAG: hypothetical protein ACPF93_06490, partial [Poseidonia sp.]
MTPRFLDRFSEEWDGTVDDSLFDRERWSVKPVVATLAGVLLMSTLGAFPISSLNDVSDAAPAGMYQWSLDSFLVLFKRTLKADLQGKDISDRLAKLAPYLE